MSETSIGGEHRMQCLSDILQRCFERDKRSLKELVHTLHDKEIISKAVKVQVFQLIKENNHEQALNQIVQITEKADGGISKFPEYLKEGEADEQLVTLVENVVAEKPHNAMTMLVRNWDALVAREQIFKREIQNIWPDQIEKLTVNWPIGFLVFCAEETSQDGAKQLLSRTDAIMSGQVKENNEATSDTNGENKIPNFEEPPTSMESSQIDSFEIIYEEDVNESERPGSNTIPATAAVIERGDESIRTDELYTAGDSSGNSREEVSSQSTSPQPNENDFDNATGQEAGFLAKEYETIEKLMNILLPIVRLLWPGEPEITDEKTWPKELIDVATKAGNEQTKNQFIKICQYIFQVTEDHTNLELQTSLDTGSTEQWIHNFDTLFEETDEQIQSIKLLMEVCWTELIDIQPSKWKEELIQKYEYEPNRTADFANACNILFKLIEQQNIQATKQETHLQIADNNIASGESVDLTEILKILSENTNFKDIADFANEKYDELNSIKDLVIPINQLFWPGEEGLTDEEDWMDELMSIETNEENSSSHQQFIKICCCLLQLKKISPTFQVCSIAQSNEAWDWMNDVLEKSNKSEVSMAILSLLLRTTWQTFESFAPDEWIKHLNERLTEDPKRFLDFANASKIMMDLIQIQVTKQETRLQVADNNIASGESVDWTEISKIISENTNFKDIASFANEKYDELNSIKDLVIPINQLFWPGEEGLTDEEDWMDELMSIETNEENSSSQQQFIKICCCLLQLKKISPTFQVCSIAKPKEAWDWMNKILQNLNKSEMSMAILSLLLRSTWQSFERFAPDEWIKHLKERYTEDPERLLDFANASKIMMDLIQACEISGSGGDGEENEQRPEEEFLKNKYEEIIADRALLVPITKLIWPEDTDIIDDENWPEKLVSVISKAEDKKPGQHFIQACQCIIDLKNDVPDFQPPPVMYAEAARGWVLAISKKILNLDDDMAMLNMILQLAWPNIEKIQPDEWTKTFLRQQKLDIDTATNFANAARIVMKLMLKMRQEIAEEQNSEELSPELEFFNKNYEAMQEARLFLQPIAHLIFPEDSIKFEEDDWMDDLLSGVAVGKYAPCIQHFFELSQNILDMIKEVPDVSSVQAEFMDIKQARAWIINYPRIFKKTEHMTKLFTRLFQIGWPLSESVEKESWTKTLLQNHKADALKTTEFVNAANVFFQLVKTCASKDEKKKDFKEFASFLNESYEEFSDSKDILLPTMKFTWPVLVDENKEENWPDDLISKIFENEDIDKSQPFMKICQWMLGIKKQSTDIKIPAFNENMDKKEMRQWAIDKTKEFQKAKMQIDLFSALLKIAWHDLKSYNPKEWKKLMFAKVKQDESRERVIEFIHVGNIILRFITFCCLQCVENYLPN